MTWYAILLVLALIQLLLSREMKLVSRRFDARRRGAVRKQVSTARSGPADEDSNGAPSASMHRPQDFGYSMKAYVEVVRSNFPVKSSHFDVKPDRSNIGWISQKIENPALDDNVIDISSRRAKAI